MDRPTPRTVLAAALLGFALAGCGGGGHHSAAAPVSGASSPADAITGVTTPSTVSVVTAKNAN